MSENGSIAAKVDHVLAAGQSRDHTCHWPGCEQQVPPAMWGCRKHWFQLPKKTRDAIWKSYRAGQEQDGTPTRAYLAAVHEARSFALQAENAQRSLFGGDGS